MLLRDFAVAVAVVHETAPPWARTGPTAARFSGRTLRPSGHAPAKPTNASFHTKVSFRNYLVYVLQQR